jgi:hypothetical protein
MDQEEALKAAIADLLERLDWGDYPRDRSTVEDDNWKWASLQKYAKDKYGQADSTLKEGIKKRFDGGFLGRRFTAFD